MPLRKHRTLFEAMTGLGIVEPVVFPDRIENMVHGGIDVRATRRLRRGNHIVHPRPCIGRMSRLMRSQIEDKTIPISRDSGRNRTDKPGQNNFHRQRDFCERRIANAVRVLPCFPIEIPRRQGIYRSLPIAWTQWGLFHCVPDCLVARSRNIIESQMDTWDAGKFVGRCFGLRLRRVEKGVAETDQRKREKHSEHAAPDARQCLAASLC